MPVAVVVPCHNEARSIRDLLDALAAQTVAPFEVVIVDDGSTDGSVEVVRQWQAANPSVALRVVPGPGRGPGPAMNAGIAAASADVIVRLDGHSVPGPDYLRHSLELVADPRVGVVGGGWRVLPGASTAVGRAIAAVVAHPLGSGGARYRHPDSTGSATISVETVPFGTFRRTLWEQLGGFDEFLAANEDSDFNYRARSAGSDVLFDRRIQTTYVARPTLTTLGRQYYRYGCWKLQMLRKDPRALHWRQVPPILLLPWVFLTGVLVASWPSPLSFLTAGLYPAALLLGSVHIATRGVQAPAALAALATVQVCWSAGFWRGVFRRSAPRR